MSRRDRFVKIVGVAVALGSTLAVGTYAGGGSASTDSSTPGAGAGGSPLDVAAARLDAFSSTVDSIGITDPVAAPDGLKIAYVQCAVPVCEAIHAGIEEAATAIGASLEVFTTQDTADTVQAAFQSAIQSDPDMVLASGNPREWFEDELAQLNDADVPVVVWSVPEPYRADGFAANLVTGDDYWFNGVLMADYVAVHTEGDANVLFLNVPQFPVLGLEQQGFEEQFAEVCPDCKLTELEFTVDQLLAGEHISAAVSELQKDDGINFVVTGFGDMLLGMPDALSGAGFDVPAISQAGTPLNRQLIADGTMQVADVALPTSFLGWRAVDAGLRAIAGQDPGTFTQPPYADFDGHPDISISGVPQRVIEADDIDDPTVPWVGVEGYQDAFSALWGR